jgi:hypothetical protein
MRPVGPLVLAALVLFGRPASGHVMSMSSGDLTVDGMRAHYELRMPLYEIVHVRDPEQTLLEHIRFAGARTVRHECRADAAHDTYRCSADYEFPAPIEQVGVECTFPSVTVPNHVHLLRAEMGGKHDQAVFDLSFTRATLRFRPPTPAEIVVTQAGAGFVRALGGAVQILFLGALVLASRRRRELLALAAMFLAGQAAAVAIVPLTAWQPPPRFVEAAAALTIAYLAVEILLLPQAGARWMIAGVLGAFHGLYLHLFVENTGYAAGLVLAGAAIAEAAAVTALALLLRPAVRWPRVRTVASCGLLAFGLIWFAIRLRG